MTLSLLDIIIIFSFFAFAVIVGLRAHKQASKNLEEYFLAGRTLKGWQAGLSMSAAQFAADTPLWITGLVATAGIFSVWRLWSWSIAFLVIAFLLGPCWRRSKVLTDAEMTELRYGQRPAAILRGVKAIYYGIVFNCTALAIVFMATTRIVEPFLLWNQWLPADIYGNIMGFIQWMGTPLTVATGDPAKIWINSTNNFISIISIVLITMCYTTTGGLRSVVATDILLFFVKMVGVVIYLWFVIHTVGGLDMIPVKLQAIFSMPQSPMTVNQLLAFTPDQANVTTIAVIVFATQWITFVSADGSGYLAQRTMACRTEKDIKVAMVIFIIMQSIVRNLMWIIIGLGLLILFPPDFSMTGDLYKATREASYVQGFNALLPAGLKGIMLTGMLAALATTVDTHMNWGASYISNDIFRRFICEGLFKKKLKDTTLVWVARGSTLIILFVSLGIMMRLSAIQVAQEIVFLLGAGIGPVLLMRWFWWRTSCWSEIACITTALVALPFLIMTFQGTMEPWRVLILGIISTVVAIIAALVAGPESPKQLAEFYERAKPPGFWGPVAVACGEEASAPLMRMLNGTLGVAAGALSLICVLVGLGTWLCSSPAPVWFPYREAWIGTLLVLGFGTIPLWFAIGFKGYQPFKPALKPASAKASLEAEPA